MEDWLKYNLVNPAWVYEGRDEMIQKCDWDDIFGNRFSEIVTKNISKTSFSVILHNENYVEIKKWLETNSVKYDLYMVFYQAIEYNNVAIVDVITAVKSQFTNEKDAIAFMMRFG